MKRTALRKSIGRSSDRPKAGRASYPFLAICVENGHNKASLQKGRAYRVLAPRPKDPPQRIRVVDEEGEDYLYLADWFVPLALPPKGRKRVLAAVL